MSQYHGTVLCLISLLFISFNVLKNYTQKKIPHTSFPYHYQLRVTPLPARTVNLIKKKKKKKACIGLHTQNIQWVNTSFHMLFSEAEVIGHLYFSDIQN